TRTFSTTPGTPAAMLADPTASSTPTVSTEAAIFSCLTRATSTLRLRRALGGGLFEGVPTPFLLQPIATRAKASKGKVQPKVVCRPELETLPVNPACCRAGTFGMMD